MTPIITKILSLFTPITTKPEIKPRGSYPMSARITKRRKK